MNERLYENLYAQPVHGERRDIVPGIEISPNYQVNRRYLAIQDFDNFWMTTSNRPGLRWKSFKALHTFIKS